MNIILKYIIRSSMEKKFRTFLIILAIAISGALFYASFSIKENLEITYTKTFLQTVGNADILIRPNEDSPGEYFSDKLVQKVKKDTSYIVNRIDKVLNYKISTRRYDMLSVVGMNLSDYKMTNTLALKQSKNLEPFTGNKIIISEKTAKYYKLNLGDTMEFMVNERLRKYEIVGISGGQGIFMNEAFMKYGLVPYDKLTEYLDTNHYPNTIYIKAKDKKDVPRLIEDIQRLYPKYEVEEPFTQEDLDEKTSMLSMSLLFITIMVSFMSVFIIYSSFRVIMLQKMPHLGTFRSVGADKHKINQVMFLESGIYGILGGILASIIGIFLSYILSAVTMPEELKAIGTKVEIKISIAKVILGFLMANGICFMSTFLPILQVSKKPIKEIVLNITTKTKKQSKSKTVIGIILLIIGGILPNYMQDSLIKAMIGMMIAMPAVSMGTIYIMPAVMNMMVTLFSPIATLLFGNLGKIAVRNVRKDTSLLNSSTLIMIGVSVLILVNSLTNNLTQELMVAVSNLIISDVDVRMKELDNSTVAHLRSYTEVKDLEGYNEISKLPVTGFAADVSTIHGVGSMDFFKFWDMDIIGDDEEIIEELQKGRNVVVSTTIQKRNRLKIGDEIELDFSEYKGEKRKYKVIGVTNTIMDAGSYIMLGQKYMQMDTKNYYYDCVGILLNEGVDREAFIEKLKKDYKDRNINITTREEVSANLHDTLAEMTSLVTGFAMIAIVVGCVGILNNFVISFIERKRSLAVLKSIGMNKKQVKKMLLIEGAIVGIVGATVGLLGGTLSFNIGPLFMTLGNVDMHLKHYPNLFLVYIIGGFLVSVVASISPAQSSSKLNIIEEIKFE